MTTAEFDILLAFCQNPGRVMTREQLLRLTHAGLAGPVERSIDVHISRVRQKIEPNVREPSFIKTVRLGGYMFTPKVRDMLMFAGLQLGSIRRQIAALAVGPIICLVILGGISELLLRDDLESVSYARTAALKIETVIEQFRVSTSAGQRAAILDATSRTGLKVEEVAASELSQGEPNVSFEDVRHLVQNNLPPGFETAFQTETSTGQLHNVLVVRVDDNRALAFLPAPPPPDAWISDQQVSIVLQLAGLVLPVVLLSLYCSAGDIVPSARVCEGGRNPEAR